MEANKKATKIYNEMEKTMVSLFSRWASESKFEDFADYMKIAERQLKKYGATFVLGNKRPFSVVFKLETGETYRISVNSRSYTCKRISL